MPVFQRNIYSIRLRTGRFFNTDWLILFIPMQWTHFQCWQMRKKSWKIVRNFYTVFEKSYIAIPTFSLIFIPPSSERKDFSTQPDWFYLYQYNEPIFNVDKWGKVMKNLYKLLILFSKNRASPCQLFSVIFIPSGSEQEDFLTQTDLFYSYQCNEPIFKVDKWWKKHENRSTRLRTERFLNATLRFYRTKRQVREALVKTPNSNTNRTFGDFLRVIQLCLTHL